MRFSLPIGNRVDILFSLWSADRTWHSTRYSILLTIDASDSTAALSFSSLSSSTLERERAVEERKMGEEYGRKMGEEHEREMGEEHERESYEGQIKEVRKVRKVRKDSARVE